MTAGFLFRLPVTVIFAILLGAMFGSVALGRRLGARTRAAYDGDARAYAGGLHTAMLGLLALLLGFTVSMAGQRFELNRDLVVDEVNAIDTAYARADLAAEPERSALKDQLRRYVDTRVDFYDVGINAARRLAVDDESTGLQAQLWRAAARNALRAPLSTAAPLLVAAVNDAIDFHAKRIDVARNHVPATLLWLLAVMAVATTGLTGYVASFGSRYHGAPTAIVIALIALVIVAIVDLDRPLRGVIQGGQQSMLDLQRTIGLRAPERGP